ncbi:MAG: STAS/SEC14 domain-containing protein [Bacteroidota bacterium]
MDYATFDHSQFPLVTITFTGAQSTDENFRTYLKNIRNIYDRKAPFVLIFDATNASLPSFKHQLMQANWLKEHNDLISKYCLGTVYIISNAFVRGILRSIFALQQQPCPYTVVENKAAGATFVEQKLNSIDGMSVVNS